MTLARFLEIIKGKVGAFESKEFDQKLNSMTKTIERINGEVDENRKIHDDTYAEVREVLYSFWILEKSTDLKLSSFDMEQKNIRLIFEKLEQRLQKKLKLFYKNQEDSIDQINTLTKDVQNLKTEDGTPSKTSLEKLKEEVETSAIAAIVVVGEELESKVTSRFIELKNSFAEIETAMQEEIKESTSKFDNQISAMQTVQLDHTQSLEKVLPIYERLRLIEEELTNLGEMKVGIDSNKQIIEGFSEALQKNVKLLETLSTNYNILSEKMSKLTQDPTTSDEEVKKLLQSKIIVKDLIRSALQEMITNSEEFEQKMKAEIDKQVRLVIQNADNKLQEYAKSELEKMTASINTKLENLETSLEETKKDVLKKYEELFSKQNTKFAQVDSTIAVLKGTKEKDLVEIQDKVLATVRKAIKDYIEEHPSEVTKSLNDELRAIQPRLVQMDRQIETFKQQVSKVAAQEKYNELEQKVKKQDKELEGLKDKYYTQTELLEKVLKQLKEKRVIVD